MSSAQLSDLPYELLCGIFAQLYSLDVAFSLAATARKFHHIWRTEAANICRTTLPLWIESFTQAEELVYIQLRGAEPLIEQGEDQDQQTFNITFEHLKRLYRNERPIARSCDRVIKELESRRMTSNSLWPQTRQSAYLTSSERARFFFAYYRFWAFAESREAEEFRGFRDICYATKYFMTVSHRDLFRIYEVFSSLSLEKCDQTSLRFPNPIFFGEISDAQKQEWARGLGVLDSGYRRRVREPPKAPSGEALGYNVIFDHLQHLVERVPDDGLMAGSPFRLVHQMLL